MLPKTLSVAEARQRFAEVLGKVAYASEEFIITRKGDSSLFPAPSKIPIASALAMNPADGWVGRSAAAESRRQEQDSVLSGIVDTRFV